MVGRRWPHALHLWSELKGERHRPHGFDLKECQNASPLGRTVWSKQNLPHGEIRVREGDGRVIRTHLDGGRLFVHVDGYGIVLHVSAYAQIAENFPWEDPCLEGTVLPAEDCPSRASDGKRLRLNSIAHNLERHAVFELELFQDWESIAGVN